MRSFMASMWLISPWRDLPEGFGKWNTVFKRFREWVKRDVFYRMFNALSDEPDMEYAMIDARGYPEFCALTW
jgi:transposase